MEARNKKIEQWFSMIAQGQLVLPRFQRHEAWKPNQIIALLENILRKPALPVGALLTLEVGNKELFHSRPIVGAPNPTDRPTMHLLDGQQRLTALWRSLTGHYSDLDVFVSISPKIEEVEDEDREPAEIYSVEAIKRWDRKGVLQPVWANHAADVLERGLIPVTILRPGGEGELVYKAWKDQIKQRHEIPESLIEDLSDLRKRVSQYLLPFLSLDVNTGREAALDVFIKMNTSASPLKDFDIVVAQLESATGESLHKMVDELVELVPAAREYGKIEDMMLSVAALLMDRAPLKKTYLDTSFGNAFQTVWPRLKHGFLHGVEFLRSEKIFNEKGLPGDVAFYLTCALWADVPESGFDAGGNARSLIRKALWRTCFTNRYGKTSATRAYADYRVLKKKVADWKDEAHCELFDERIYPLPEKEELTLAGWPSRKDRLPRAILASTLRAGGFDFADAAPIGPADYDKRELHHLYPVQVLGGDRSDERVNRALNCALVSWTTNRRVGAQTPKEYITKRAEAASLGEAEVRFRLESHRVPYDALIGGDYEAFLSARADLVLADMLKLCNGQSPK